jgi:hypothetical protein
MSEEIQKAQSVDDCSNSGRAPFPLLCFECGADIDAPDQLFECGVFAPVPHTEHVLMTVSCLTCGYVHELALGLFDRKAIQEAGEELAQLDGERRADTLALVERYRAAVTGFRRIVERQLAESEELPTIDLRFLELAFQPRRCIAVAMEALAACRGLREAVAERPGLLPPVRLVLGRYLCVLSFDKIDGRPHPWALHLSISNWVAPGHLPPADLRWLLSLFFSAGEVPFLETQPGVTKPLTHYWLPAYEPELNAC